MKSIDETLDVTAQVLIRCTILGVASLLLWWGALALFGDLAYAVHSSMTPVTREQFDVIHYTGMLTTKTAVSLLFLFPYIAVRLVMRKRARRSE